MCPPDLQSNAGFVLLAMCCVHKTRTTNLWQELSPRTAWRTTLAAMAMCPLTVALTPLPASSSSS